MVSLGCMVLSLRKNKYLKGCCYFYELTEATKGRKSCLGSALEDAPGSRSSFHPVAGTCSSAVVAHPQEGDHASKRRLEPKAGSLLVTCFRQTSPASQRVHSLMKTAPTAGEAFQTPRPVGVISEPYCSYYLTQKNFNIHFGSILLSVLFKALAKDGALPLLPRVTEA